MSKTIIYVKHVTESTNVPLSPNMTYWQWCQSHELRRDPSVSVEDFYGDIPNDR
jgi:hypothetical protein